MRGKLVMWGAAAMIALGSTAAMGSVVVVKSLGPSSKAYPPGKTLARRRQDQPAGRRRRHFARPGQRADPARTRQFSHRPGGGELGRRVARPLRSARAAEVAKNPSIWDIDVTQSGKMCVTSTSKVQLWRPEADSAVTIKIRSADGQSRGLDWAAGAAHSVGPRSADQIRRAISARMAGNRGQEQLTFIAVPNAPPDLVGAAQVLIQNGCQHQLDLLVDSASKRGE